MFYLYLQFQDVFSWIRIRFFPNRIQTEEKKFYPDPAPEKKPGADPKEDGFETLRQTENTSELWLKNPYCEVDGFSGFVTCFLAADLGTGGVSCLLGACITQPVLNTGTGTSQLAAI